jgi:branched-chain amino acid transport system permease protein
MNAPRRPAWLRFEVIALAVLLFYPIAPVIDYAMDGLGLPIQLDRELVNIFIFAILALALNMQVGYAGLLQLGIAAFFAIGAYTTGIFTVGGFPFQIEFWGALAAAPLAAGLFGLMLGAPTIRLRGDYLAIVTLGFGEVTRVVLINLENITAGQKGLNPIPSPWLPTFVSDAPIPSDRTKFLTMYYLALVLLAALVILFRTLERSRMGRQLVALREDELASACMGINPARTKLLAFAFGAAVAGLAGALYATNLTTTAEPNTYGFNSSIFVLCGLIVGGLGSLRGALLGAALLTGFDKVIAPLITKLLSKATEGSTNVLLNFTNYRWLLFGLALVLMMRFRPEGLWPSSRMKAELHHGEEQA